MKAQMYPNFLIKIPRVVENKTQQETYAVLADNLPDAVREAHAKHKAIFKDDPMAAQLGYYDWEELNQAA